MSRRGQPPPSLSNVHRPQTVELSSWPVSRPASRASSAANTRGNVSATQSSTPTRRISFEQHDDDDSDFEDDLGRMGDRRPPLHRPTDGRSEQPLLHNGDQDRGRPSNLSSPDTSGRPPLFTRRSTLRSRSPDTQARLATKKKYTYAAFFLMVSLVSFVVQTETAVYIQSELGWNKAYCMLYLTHGSWSVLWPAQLVILRLQKWNMPWETFWRRHVYLVRTTAQMVQTQELSVPRSQGSPVLYMIRMTAFVTCALTVAGGSWYVAVDMTSPSDLTAIYNCSAFFAYVFSVPILKEKLRLDKSLAVLLAIIGVLIVSYAPSKTDDATPDPTEPKNRVMGNLVIGVGSVLYGFYEVLYKRLACPPEGTSPGRGMIFANTFGSLIGSFTLLVLWIPLPILHILGLERFELPRGEAAWMLLISVLANATFSGAFLVLISLTSPVLSSVAALLTIFLVAITDWLWRGKTLAPVAIGGGLLIVIAFLLLSWSTFREMSLERKKKQIDLSDSDESDKDDD